MTTTTATSDSSYIGYNSDAAAAEAATAAGEFFAAGCIHRQIAAKLGLETPRGGMHCQLAALNEGKALQRHLSREGRKPSRSKLAAMLGQVVRVVMPAFKEITAGRLVKIEYTASGKTVRAIHVDSGYRSPSVFSWGDVGVVDLVS